MLKEGLYDDDEIQLMQEGEVPLFSQDLRANHSVRHCWVLSIKSNVSHSTMLEWI